VAAASDGDGGGGGNDDSGIDGSEGREGGATTPEGWQRQGGGRSGGSRAVGARVAFPHGGRARGPARVDVGVIVVSVGTILVDSRGDGGATG
jgi:hypothetical protein